MHEQDTAIIRALVPVIWADGEFADTEREMLEALLQAYNATSAEREALLAYASERRELGDIELENLSFADRRVVLQHATMLSFLDGTQGAAEKRVLQELADKLRIPESERAELCAKAAERAKIFLELL
jgi:uncharacterized tellurite resistance protein B-like protein